MFLFGRYLFIIVINVLNRLNGLFIRSIKQVKQVDTNFFLLNELNRSFKRVVLTRHDLTRIINRLAMSCRVTHLYSCRVHVYGV